MLMVARNQSKHLLLNGEMREIKVNSKVMKSLKLSVVPTKENFTLVRLGLKRDQKVFSRIIVILSETVSFVILKSNWKLLF